MTSENIGNIYIQENIDQRQYLILEFGIFIKFYKKRI